MSAGLKIASFNFTRKHFVVVIFSIPEIKGNRGLFFGNKLMKFGLFTKDFLLLWDSIIWDVKTVCVWICWRDIFKSRGDLEMPKTHKAFHT